MKSLQSVCRIVSRGIATTGSRKASQYGGFIPASKKYNRIMELQTMMTRNDGLLVWQKRGLRDNIPFYITMTLSYLGIGVCVCLLVSMALPKKAPEE